MLRRVLAVAALAAGCQGALDDGGAPAPQRLFVLPPPELVAARAARPVLPVEGSHVVFVNFGGARLETGTCDDAARNCTHLVQCGRAIDYPPYAGSAEQKAMTVALVEEYFRPFDVGVVTTRPPEGVRYMMVMVGGTPEAICVTSTHAGGEVAGLATLDCANSAGDTEIVFAFASVPFNDPHAVAVTIAQEAGHAYGLEHTNDAHDIMFPYLSREETGFLDQTMPVERSGGCVQGTQNSFMLLGDTVGFAAGQPADTEAPTVRFATPPAGAAVAGQGLAVKVDAVDRRGVQRVELVVDPGTAAEVRHSDDQTPFDFIIDLELGAHVLEAVATDRAGNRGTARVTFSVDRSTDMPILPVGASCSSSDQCSGQCLSSGPAIGRCAGPCSPGGGCPDLGNTCLDYNHDGKLLCLPDSLLNPRPLRRDDQGCAAASGRAPAPWALVLVLALAAALRRR